MDTKDVCINIVNPDKTSLYEQGFIEGLFANNYLRCTFPELAHVVHDRLLNSTDEEKRYTQNIILEVLKPMREILSRCDLDYIALSANPLGWVIKSPENNKEILIYSKEMLMTKSGERKYMVLYKAIDESNKIKLYKVEKQKKC